MDPAFFTQSAGVYAQSFCLGTWSCEPRAFPSVQQVQSTFTVYSLLYALPGFTGSQFFINNEPGLSSSQFVQTCQALVRLLGATVHYDDATHPGFTIQACDVYHGLAFLMSLASQPPVVVAWDNPATVLCRRGYTAFFFRRLHEWLAIYLVWLRRSPDSAQVRLKVPSAQGFFFDWVFDLRPRGGTEAFDHSIDLWRRETESVCLESFQTGLTTQGWPLNYPTHLIALLSPVAVPQPTPAPTGLGNPNTPKKGRKKQGKPRVVAQKPLVMWNPNFAQQGRSIGSILKQHGPFAFATPVAIGTQQGSRHVCFEFTVVGQSCSGRCRRVHLDLADPGLTPMSPHANWFQPFKEYLIAKQALFLPTPDLQAHALWTS